MLRKPEETEHLFISYSRQDQEIVTPVVQLMRLGQAPVFQDVNGISPGKRWRVVLADSIAGASRLVIFWCVHSASSPQVQWEYQEGMRLGKELVPARLDGTSLPDDLGEYQGIDLSRAVTHTGLDACPRKEAWYPRRGRWVRWLVWSGLGVGSLLYGLHAPGWAYLLLLTLLLLPLLLFVPQVASLVSTAFDWWTSALARRQRKVHWRAEGRAIADVITRHLYETRHEEAERRPL